MITLLPVLISGFGGGATRGLIGYLKHQYSYKNVGFDVKYFTVMMFLSAIFYPLTALPEKYQGWLRLNPLVLIISESRNVLIFGALPDWFSLGVALLVGFGMAMAGFWWFQKMRKGFADVI